MSSIIKRTATIATALTGLLGTSFAAFADEESCMAQGDRANVERVADALLVKSAEDIDVDLSAYSAKFLGQLNEELAKDRTEGLYREADRTITRIRNALDDGDVLDFDDLKQNSPLGMWPALDQLAGVEGTISATMLEHVSVKAKLDISEHVAELQALIGEAYESKAGECLEIPASAPGLNA